MHYHRIALGLVAAAMMAHTPVRAQDTTDSGAAVSSAHAGHDDAPCELHVWPTENYLGVKMGLLSGFGALGAVADQAANKKGVSNIKTLMRDYLGPDIQMKELESLDYVSKLGLDKSQYRVIVHPPTPWNEDIKQNPELKAATKALNKKIKAGQRITDSDNACYAELITTHIFYHKAMMYGSNLFTGWNFRQFDGDKLVSSGAGQVKNPLEHFPPKEETMIEAARIELRDAYSRDFSEWVEKKSGT